MACKPWSLAPAGAPPLSKAQRAKLRRTCRYSAFIATSLMVGAVDRRPLAVCAPLYGASTRSSDPIRNSPGPATDPAEDILSGSFGLDIEDGEEFVEYDCADAGAFLHELPGRIIAMDGRLDGLNLQSQAEPTESVLETVKRWLKFLKETGDVTFWEHITDASGYPLEEALELAIEEFARGAATIVTLELPDGFSKKLGPIGLVAKIREGEDLDLSLLGGSEWETIHLDFMATNPLLAWASDVKGDIDQRLEAAGGVQMLKQLLQRAGEAGRAVTVAPLSDQLKERYRELGFKEESMLDPTLMFWVPPSDEDFLYAFS